MQELRDHLNAKAHGDRASIVLYVGTGRDAEGETQAKTVAPEGAQRLERQEYADYGSGWP